jgi:hypothetical protein
VAIAAEAEFDQQGRAAWLDTDTGWDMRYISTRGSRHLYHQPLFMLMLAISSSHTFSCHSNVIRGYRDPGAGQKPGKTRSVQGAHSLSGDRSLQVRLRYPHIKSSSVKYSTVWKRVAKIARDPRVDATRPNSIDVVACLWK